MDIQKILSRYEKNQENILAILHEIQEHDANQHISREAMNQVASYLQVPLSTVYGVLRYYSMYSTTPRGRNLIRVCNSVVCQMLGGEILMEKVQQVVADIERGQEGSKFFSVETTECLGHCEKAPVMMLNDQMESSVDPQSVKNLLVKISKI